MNSSQVDSQIVFLNEMPGDFIVSDASRAKDRPACLAQGQRGAGRLMPRLGMLERIPGVV